MRISIMAMTLMISISINLLVCISSILYILSIKKIETYPTLYRIFINKSLGIIAPHALDNN